MPNATTVRPTSDQLEQEVAFVSRPVPDPTERTVQQTQREIAASREIVETKIEGLRSEFTTRINGMDTALQLLQVNNNKIPELIISQVKQLKEVVDEKFSSIAMQFSERDTRTEQTGRLNDTALQAAFSAAKSAVADAQTASALANTKMENTFQKNFESVNQLIITIQESLADKLSDLRKVFDDKLDTLKEQISSVENRVQANESRTSAGRDQRKDISATWAVLLAAASMCIGLIMALFAIFHH